MTVAHLLILCFLGYMVIGFAVSSLAVHSAANRLGITNGSDFIFSLFFWPVIAVLLLPLLLSPVIKAADAYVKLLKREKEKTKIEA